MLGIDLRRRNQFGHRRHERQVHSSVIERGPLPRALRIWIAGPREGRPITDHGTGKRSLARRQRLEFADSAGVVLENVAHLQRMGRAIGKGSLLEGERCVNVVELVPHTFV